MKRIDRCPWCGKIMNEREDKGEISIPHNNRRVANCSHCFKKYGQVPTFPHAFINIIIAFAGILPCAAISDKLLGNPILLVGVEFVAFLWLSRKFTPYSKLDDRGRQVDINNDMLCCALIIETYGKLKCNEIYFLSDDFDLFEPYTLASPIHVYHINKKEKYVTGEFLYMHEKNYDYIDKDVCELYDSNMKLIAKVKITTDIE